MDMPFPGEGVPLFWSTYTHTHDRLDKLRSALAEAQLKNFGSMTVKFLQILQQRQNDGLFAYLYLPCKMDIMGIWQI